MNDFIALYTLTRANAYTPGWADGGFWSGLALSQNPVIPGIINLGEGEYGERYALTLHLGRTSSWWRTQTKV